MERMSVVKKGDGKESERAQLVAWFDYNSKIRVSFTSFSPIFHFFSF